MSHLYSQEVSYDGSRGREVDREPGAEVLGWWKGVVVVGGGG